MIKQPIEFDDTPVDVDLSFMDTIESKSSKLACYKLLADNGYDFDDLDKNRLPVTLAPILNGDLLARVKFNQTLMRLHHAGKLNIVEFAGYLVEDFFDPEILLTKIFQAEVIMYITNTLDDKHGVSKKTDTSKLSKFMK